MNAIESVIAERKRQDEKWGDQRKHEKNLWLVILGEEYGEACMASLEQDDDGYRKELVQVAAVAVAAIESYDLQKQSI